MDEEEEIAAVRHALDETEAEYSQMPLVVRLMVRRGFVKRTGHDFAAWRKLLDGAKRGIFAAQLLAVARGARRALPGRSGTRSPGHGRESCAARDRGATVTGAGRRGRRPARRTGVF